MKRFLFKMLYRLFDYLDETFKSLAERCNNGYWWAKERHWFASMPSWIHKTKYEGRYLPEYCCPFCDKSLDYRIDYDGISVGVCWDCDKSWLETWDNSDCPMYDNFKWPTRENVSTEKPSPFWEDSVGHMFMKNADGLSVDQGKVDNAQGWNK